MKVKKGDTVLVITGDDRGRMGKVLKVFPDKSRAVVEGVNFIKRHTRPSPKNRKGGIIEKEAPIHISNVLVYCPKCSSPTKISFGVLRGEGETKSTKVRICRKCGEII